MTSKWANRWGLSTSQIIYTLRCFFAKHMQPLFRNVHDLTVISSPWRFKISKLISTTLRNFSHRYHTWLFGTCISSFKYGLICQFLKFRKWCNPWSTSTEKLTFFFFGWRQAMVDEIILGTESKFLGQQCGWLPCWCLLFVMGGYIQCIYI